MDPWTREVRGGPLGSSIGLRMSICVPALDFGARGPVVPWTRGPVDPWTRGPGARGPGARGPGARGPGAPYRLKNFLRASRR